MLATMAMMLAIVVILSALESMLPPLPFAPPGIRLGLANVVSMYALLMMGKKQAIVLVVLKSAFVFISRGVFAGFLSASGGFFSLLLIVLLIVVYKNASYIAISVVGAMAFNFAQITVASIILSTNILILYWPYIIIGGVVLGSITGKVLQVVMPYFQKLR